MTQYFVIIADSELELIPEGIHDERSVQTNARTRGKHPGKILLDASHHHPAFGKLPESERRGRPDIVHFCLLLCLDSNLSAEGNLKVFVHTRNDDVIAVKPETRLPPHYIRFIGLIESLYEQRVVPSRENPLLELRQGVTLEALVNALKPDQVLVLEQDGAEVSPGEVLVDPKAERVVVIVGGFSKGRFKSDIRKLDPKVISFGKRQMKAWTAVSRLLCSIECSSEGAAAPDADVEPVKPPKPAKPRRAPRKKAA